MGSGSDTQYRLESFWATFYKKLRRETSKQRSGHPKKVTAFILEVKPTFAGFEESGDGFVFAGCGGFEPSETAVAQ